ncbi:hypothetical protein TheetDRAFT_2615 [Thermoanaerobacter ethanolicus JW 200]|nr:hypothetical protein TheetDRAFT_2615 [Thermoanaerobacter ethanolicus JW 200]
MRGTVPFVCVAAYVSQIPGFEAIVNLIRYDKGLDLAVRNDFIQPLNISKEYDGVKVTIGGIIVDESHIIIFYSIKNESGKSLELKNIEAYNEKNQPLEEISLSWSGFDNNSVEKGSFIDIAFSGDNNSIPEVLNLSIEFKGLKYNTFNFSIHIDKNKFKGLKEVYAVNRTMEIDGQKITFEKVIIYPTRIALYIHYDPLNSKKILGYPDIGIVDEKGDIFGQISNGVSGTRKDDNNIILYFQSNYFKKPKELYVAFSKVKAIDKDKAEVIIDLKNKMILKKPDEKLKLNDIVYNKNDIQLTFTLEKIDNTNNLYSPFYSEFEDSSMKKYHFLGEEIHGGREGKVEEVLIRIPNVSYDNPIKLKIIDYPNFIGGKEVKVRVKQREVIK